MFGMTYMRPFIYRVTIYSVETPAYQAD